MQNGPAAWCPSNSADQLKLLMLLVAKLRSLHSVTQNADLMECVEKMVRKRSCSLAGHLKTRRVSIAIYCYAYIGEKQLRKEHAEQCKP